MSRVADASSTSKTSSLKIAPGHPLGGTVRVPGDKSISHRALIFGAMAEGTSLIRGLSDGEDVLRTEHALKALGATVEELAAAGAKRVSGGEGFPSRPAEALECGNSGTSIRLLAGVAAGRGWSVRLQGDESLSSRPMDRVADPLRMMGAEVSGTTDRCFPPLQLGGGPLEAIDYSPSHASAQVKSCVLLAGLHADGETVVREIPETRRHTEELLELCAADCEEG